VNKLPKERPSRWSCSITKRLFDIVCVVSFLPLWLPVLSFIAVAVRFTSRGPVFFLQKRVGKGNELFTIIKFRTLKHSLDDRRPAVTTTKSRCFTSIGPFLRHWKLDELPQVFNVLVGDMSLVGARPKLPEHQIGELQCRPGITGAATIAFARESKMLASIPKNELDDFYREVVLPTKMSLDVEYMARATFLSDLKLIVKSATRHWGDSSISLEDMTQETLEVSSR